MRHLIRLLACLLVVATCTSCSTEGNVSNDAREALAAYLDFVKELRACGNNQSGKPAAETCDKEKIWNALDVQSKSQFFDAYVALDKMDKIIETYFDPIEHKYMRSKTGTDVLKAHNIKNHIDLFFYIFKPETLNFNDETESGISIEGDDVQNANMITLITHSKDRVVMIRESDNVWRISSLQNYINIALEPIFASETAMREIGRAHV